MVLCDFKCEISTFLRAIFAAVDLPAHPDGDPDDHGGDGDARNQRDPHRGAHQRAQLPHQLLLAAPWLLSPESASCI